MKLVIEIDKKAFDYIMACSFVENEAVVLNQSLEDRIKTLMFFDVLNAIKIGTPLTEWLNSFDTSSATKCFEAVNLLKQRLEGEE